METQAGDKNASEEGKGGKKLVINSQVRNLFLLVSPPDH